jgi:hypothetical protein
MFSIAQSRYRFLVQFLFLALNAVGVLLVTIYNANTPDLYSNNAHHKIGWLMLVIVSAQIGMGVVSAYAKRHDAGRHADRTGLIPVSTEAIAEHQRIHNSRFAELYRFSNDSGQGTERNTESLRSHSVSSNGKKGLHSPQSPPHEEIDDGEEQHSLLQNSRVDQFLSKRLLHGLLSNQALRALQFLYDAVDRVILLLGFLAVTTGIVTYGGLFVSLFSGNPNHLITMNQKGDRIFSGLAHFIKGGVFFWYGVLTLGRWAGCFADIGWVR